MPASAERPQDAIFIELDMDTLHGKRELLAECVPHIGHFCVGQRLATAVGLPKVNEFIRSLEGKIFYDARLCLPSKDMIGVMNTLAFLDTVDMVSVRFTSGWRSIQAAMERRGRKEVAGVASTLKLSAYMQLQGGREHTNSTNAFFSAGGNTLLCPAWEMKTLQREHEELFGSVGTLNLITSDVRPSWKKPTRREKTGLTEPRTPRVTTRRGAHGGVVIRWSDLIAKKSDGLPNLPKRLSLIKAEILAARVEGELALASGT